MNSNTLDQLTAAAHSNQRRHTRVDCGSEAVLRVGSWPRRRKLRGTVRNASLGGLLIDLDGKQALHAGDSARIEWDVPTALKGIETPRRLKQQGSIIWTSSSSATASAACAVKFSQILPERLEKREAWLVRTLLVSFTLLLGAAVLWPSAQNYIWFWYKPFFQLYSLLFAGFVAFRLILCLFYRQPGDDGYMPSVSIIIPAFNEGPRIIESVSHAFAVHYPASRLEVLVVDDGSSDDTWASLESCADQYPNLVLHRFAENRGKHHAMVWGAMRATGEILIFVDSDSMVEPESLYKIVQPFTNPRIGAVAGQVLVQVEAGHFISKMESVHYFLYRINKAVESLFGAVTCCPGAFSAYRRQLVVDAIPEWLMRNGDKVMLGDDRSLTNCILATHEVIYHHGATARTYVPRTWRQYFRQQIRWKKSWLQETAVAARLMVRRHPVMVLSFYIEIALTLISPFLMTYVLFYLPFVAPFAVGPYVLNLLLLYGLYGLMHRYHEPKSYWYYAMTLLPLYITILSWQNFYAMLTLHRNSWSTR